MAVLNGLMKNLMRIDRNDYEAADKRLHIGGSLHGTLVWSDALKIAYRKGNMEKAQHKAALPCVNERLPHCIDGATLRISAYNADRTRGHSNFQVTLAMSDYKYFNSRHQCKKKSCEEARFHTAE